MSVNAQSCLTFATPWTVTHQAPLPMEFSRPEYWSGLLIPSLGDLLNPGITRGSPALQADSLPSEPPGKPPLIYIMRQCWATAKENFAETTASWTKVSLFKVKISPSEHASAPWLMVLFSYLWKTTQYSVKNRMGPLWAGSVVTSGLSVPLGLSLCSPYMHAQLLSHVWLLVIPWIVAYQGSLSLIFPRQEYWSGLPFPSLGDLLNPETETVSPALAGRFFFFFFFYHWATHEATINILFQKQNFLFLLYAHFKEINSESIFT